MKIVGRDQVVRVALQKLNEVGLDGLTLRGIAGAMGVQAPTLYWRFKSKQDLIDEMATQVFADWASEEAPTEHETWQGRAMAFGRGLRGALLRYRDGARMVAGTYLTEPALYRGMEQTLQYFASSGIAPTDAGGCLNTVYCYVIGFVIEEQAVRTPAGELDSRYTSSARNARLDEKQYSLTRGAGAAFFGDEEARLEKALRAIIAGYEILWAREAASASSG